MLWKNFAFAALFAALTGCTTVQKIWQHPPADPLAAFQERAAKYNAVVTVPTFETTPEAVYTTADKTINDGNAALEGSGQVRTGADNLMNTIGDMDDIA